LKYKNNKPTIKAKGKQSRRLKREDIDIAGEKCKFQDQAETKPDFIASAGRINVSPDFLQHFFFTFLRVGLASPLYDVRANELKQYMHRIE